MTEIVEMTATPRRNPFAVRDFRLLWIGEAVSALGDQFVLIALPWLALVLTGSALALAGVLAVMAIPRAVLMLVGGVSVDRLSPRRVMLISNAVRFVALAMLGSLVLAGMAELWMLYVFALVFGIADAFFFPAQTSIVPELVESDQLQRANGIVQGTAQATVLLGPGLAGVVIAGLGSSGADPAAAGTAGIAAALLIDAVTFIVSLVSLWLIRPRAHAERPASSMLDDMRAGLAYVLKSPGLRVLVVLSLAANLLIVGPFEVGVPVLAYTRLPEGAAAFGVLMAAFGGGSLGGLVLASVLPAPRPSRFAAVVIGATALAGASLIGLPLVRSTALAAALIASSGVALGFGNLHALTWMQSRIPSDLMGRVMSVMMMASVGLVPVSMLIAGAAVQISLDGMLIVAGLGMALLCGVSLLAPAVRRLGLEPPYQGTEMAEAAAGVASAPTEPARA